MIRLLGGLGLAAPVVLLAVLIAMPTAIDSWANDGAQSVIAAIAAGAIGVSLSAVVFFIYTRLLFRGIVRASERLAGGELGVVIRAPAKGHGLEGRLARAVNAISEKLA